MLIYAGVFSALGILRFHTSRYGDPDFGVFEQSFWTTVREGLLFYNTFEGGSHFRTHNSPIFFLLLPVYALAPCMPTLLVLQACAAALGAWPVYLLARHQLQDERAGRSLALVYLLYHPLHGVTYDQFNELSFVPAPLLFAFYFLATQRWTGFWISALLAMAGKEDMTFVVAAFGLYAAGMGAVRKSRAQVAHGAALALVAMAWLWLTLAVIFPHYRGGEEWPYFAHRYGHLGSTFSEAIVTIVTRPDLVLPDLLRPRSFELGLELTVPLALLPFLAPEVLLVAAPTWGILALSTFTGTMNTGSRYMAPVIAVLFAATVVGLQRLQARGWSLDRVLRWPLGLTLAAALLLNNTPLRVPFKNLPLPDEHLRHRQELLRLVPPDASISTQGDFYGHVAHRLEAYIGYRPGVEFLLVDTTERFRPWYEEATWDRDLAPLLQTRQYVLVRRADGVELYRRAGHEGLPGDSSN